LPDFYRWCRPNPESCLAALCSEIEELEPVAERIISVVDALELETCPITLIHQSDIVFNVPFVITASGRYCLAEDLLVTCSVGIVITGSGITLDLNGHSIIVNSYSSCDFESIGVEVFGDAPASDIVIKNGTITSVIYDDCTTTGIWLNGCDGDYGDCDHEVIDVRIENVALTNLCYGVYVGGAVGTVINNASFHFNKFDLYCAADSATTITNSIFFESDFGLVYCDSENMIVRDCSFSEVCAAVSPGNCGGGLLASEFTRCNVNNTNSNGFKFVGASGLLVCDCRSSRNNGNGFHFSDSGDVVVRDCVASDNSCSPDAYSCFYSSSSSSSSSSISCSSSSSSVYFHADGFFIEDSQDVCLYNCFSQDNLHNGFGVNSSAVLVRNCTATDNGSLGFADTSSTNQYYANYACNNAVVRGVESSSNYSDTITSASVTSPDNARGVHNVDCANTAVDQIDAIESIVENISSVVDAVCSCSLIEAIVTDIDEQLFALSSVVDHIAETGDDCSVILVRNVIGDLTLSRPGRYCLAEDITVGTILITGNSIILDLNGHTVYGGSAVGIAVTGNDVTIKNGSIGSGLHGISANTVNALCIEDVSCTNCDNGIELLNVDDVLLNNVISYLNIGNGLLLLTVNNLLAQACLLNNNGNGVDGNFINDSEFVNCIANFNHGSAGFSVSGAVNVVLRDCFASHNQDADGFDISGGNNVCLYNCYAKSNDGIGFLLENGTTALLRNCTAINNGHYGFSDLAGTSQYYANYACNNHGTSMAPNNSVNYNNVISAPVTSPANARDFSNVDCNNSDVDQIAAIHACQMCGG